MLFRTTGPDYWYYSTQPLLETLIALSHLSSAKPKPLSLTFLYIPQLAAMCAKFGVFVECSAVASEAWTCCCSVIFPYEYFRTGDGLGIHVHRLHSANRHAADYKLTKGAAFFSIEPITSIKAAQTAQTSRACRLVTTQEHTSGLVQPTIGVPILMAIA